MSAGAEAELQRLIIERLRAFDQVAALVAGRVYDIVPDQPTFPYLSLGPHDLVEDDAECILGSEHSVQVDAWSRHPGGFSEAKRIGAAARRALHHHAGDLGFDALVEMRVVAIRYLRDPDGLTSHAALTVTAMVEEATA